jgi:predicted small secreted protein
MKASLKLFSLLAAGSFLFASCDKNEGTLNGAGQTIVKLPQGADEKVALALDFKPGLQDVLLLDVRRDVPNNSELQKTHVVKIKNDPTIVADYNSAHGTNYIPLPAAAFTVDPSNPFNGTEWTVTFNPGDHAKPIMIKLDPTKLDLSKQYALGFTITDASGAKISNGLSSAMVEVGVKNRYDGIYRVTGTMVDIAAPTITGYFPQDVDLITIGAASVVMVPKDLGIPGHLILSGTSLSYYGSFGPVFTFDLATDKVISVTNSYGQPAGNTRSAEIDPSGINKWNASDKSMDVKYFMKQPNTVTTPPNIRVFFDEHFQYLGSR